MAQNFGQLQDTVQKMFGDYSAQTKNHVKKWINTARNALWELVHGNYKEKTDYITTTVAYKTGTVSVNQGATTVTGVGTTWTSAMAGRLMQFSGSEPWYRIASFTSVTELELEDAYIGSNVSAGTYEIHTYLWSLPADVQRLIQVALQDEENWTSLAIIDRVDFYNTMPVPLRWDNTGTSEVCWIDEEDSDGNIQLGIWPVPDGATLAHVRYEKVSTDLSADADALEIPGAEEAITYLALVSAFTYKGRTRDAALFEQKYEKALNRLLSTVRRGKNTTYRRADHSNVAGGRRHINMGSLWPRRQ